MRTIFALAMLALAGCASQSPEQIAATDRETCTSYGYPVGHPDHGNCMILLAQQRHEMALAEAQVRAAASRNPGPALGGAALLQQAIQPR